MDMHDRGEKCKEVFSLLSEYLNMELPSDACREMETHIADCAPCVEFAESLRKTVDLCRAYKPAEMPAPMEANAREQLLAAYKKMMNARTDASAST